jgi:hypothetical protein
MNSFLQRNRENFLPHTPKYDLLKQLLLVLPFDPSPSRLSRPPSQYTELVFEQANSNVD